MTIIPDGRKRVKALAALREQAWWDLTPDSPEVVVARTLYPNQ